MSIVAFSPFGLAREESGIIALLTNYLKRGAWQVSSLRCNGIFSLCDRDVESNWNREVKSCFECMHEHARIARWCDVPVADLSAYLTPNDIVDSKRWLLSSEAQGFSGATYKEFDLHELCSGSLKARCGTALPDFRGKGTEAALKRILLSAVRTIMASESWLRRNKPELLLVSSGGDFITSAFSAVARARNFKVALFRWDLSARAVVVHHPLGLRQLNCPLVFEDITTMRPDSRTWPWEITQILDDLLQFLDITSTQLELPIAN